MSKHVYQHLYTAEGEALSPNEIPWNTYPRPQMRRTEWLCLNGTWRFTAETPDGFKSDDIRVPFCPESLLSGIGFGVKPGAQMKYERTFTIPDGWRGKRILLHFGAVSRSCRVYINGVDRAPVGTHENGYLPFSVDITDALREGENTLTVYAVNDLDRAYPYGKQRKKRGGMWYTPCSGIWQTVWLEPVSEKNIEKLKISVDLTGADIEICGVLSGVLTCAGEDYPFENGKVRIEPESPRLWSPEDPYLYDFTVKTEQDEIQSYFALRTVSIETVNGIPRLCLNGKPYFFHALLDQGYYSDGLYTPASPSLYEQDILSMKSLGFNTLRKHIKIEPEQFYYDCDRLGMVVFQDMVNNGRYRYFYDTILPTLRIRRLPERGRFYSKHRKGVFLMTMEETVALLFNHPSVCYYTIFNEGWGQFCADDAYTYLKDLDGSRIIDTTSGWFQKKLSDVESSHFYFERLHLGKRQRPQVLSEFGGYVWKDEKHSFNLSKTYGYKIFKTREDFAAALRSVYIEQILPLARRGLCASVLTQLSDVEDETNGLLTFDRRVLKTKPEELSDVAKMLQSAVTSGKE